MRLISIAMLAAACIACGTAGPVAYAINFSAQFGTIDLTSGAFTAIGPGSPNALDGIGGKPGGPFYGIDSVTGHLMKIGTDGSIIDVGDTGTGAQIGPGGVSINGSLTTGALYAIDFSNHLLLTNPLNGSTANLGLIAGLAPSEQIYIGNLFTSLAGNTTDLFYTLEIPGGPLAIAPTLYDINPITRTSTSVLVTGISGIIGSGWINGQLYGFTGLGDIVTINTTTGVATMVANYDSGLVPDGPPLTGIFGAVATTPEPSTVLLSIAGLVLIAVRARRSGILDS